MTEARYVSLKSEQGDSTEQKLVASVPQHARDLLRLLKGDSDDMVINAKELSDGRPDGSNSGLAVKGVLLDVRFIDTKDKEKMCMVRLLVDEKVRLAIQALDTNKAGDSSLVCIDDFKAMARVDVRYQMTPEDRAAVEASFAARKAKLSPNRKNGNVSVGVKALYTGMVLSLSMYKVPDLKSGGVDVTAGAVVQFNGVQFTLEWNGASYGDRPSCHAAKYSVIKNDEGNASRLATAMDLASTIPPLDPSAPSSFSLGAWPSGMHVIRDEIPAHLRGMESGSAGNGILRIEGKPADSADDMDTDNDTNTKLVVPARPNVYMGVGEPFVAHVGETEAQELARLAVGSTAGVPTSFMRPVLSTDKDALQYEDANKNERVRVKFALPGSQIIAGERVPVVIHCTVPTGDATQMLSATAGNAGQVMVLPAMVAALQGPLLIEPKVAGDHEYESDAFHGALNFTSYCSTIPPVVLQLTVPRAGFLVSSEFMLMERAIAARTANVHTQAASAAAGCAYYQVDGAPTKSSGVLMLNSTPFGYFDDAGQAKLHEKIKPHLTAGADKQRQAVAPLLGELKGPLVDILASHDFYVVGRIVPTVEVIEHQKQAREDDIDALMKNNEQLMTTGQIPAAFPRDIYQAAIEASPAPPARLAHYAVVKSVSDGSFVHARMKRQIEKISSNSKRLAVENSAGTKEEVD